MVHCPKCNEIIGEKKSICPVCHHVFTDQELKDMENERNSYDVKLMDDRRARIAAFAKKRRSLAGIMMVILLGFPVLSLFFMHNAIVLIILLVSYFVGSLGVIIVGISSGAFRCPHCDSILFRNYGSYCHTCGKPLE
ncbi:MAG: hypothetical protein IKR23_05305 [Lachnospiraceae bacterium]|nr:hypothetical protein [Lachnospiraceae bacterium]